MNENERTNQVIILAKASSVKFLLEMIIEYNPDERITLERALKMINEIESAARELFLGEKNCEPITSE